MRTLKDPDNTLAVGFLMKNEFNESGSLDLLAGIKPGQSGPNHSPCHGAGVACSDPFFLTLACSAFIMSPADHRSWNSSGSCRQASVIDF